MGPVGEAGGVLRFLRAALMMVGGLAGLLAFVLVPLVLVLMLIYGGSAMNGYREGARYFLVAHAKSSEVSRAVYTTMLWLERSAVAAVLFFAVGALAMAAGKGFRRR